MICTKMGELQQKRCTRARASDERKSRMDRQKKDETHTKYSQRKIQERVVCVHSHPRKVAKSRAYHSHIKYILIIHIRMLVHYTCSEHKACPVHPHSHCCRSRSHTKPYHTIHIFLAIRSNSENTYPLCCYKIFEHLSSCVWGPESISLVLCVMLHCFTFCLFVSFGFVRSLVRSFLFNLSYVFVWLARFKRSPDFISISI